MKIGRLQFSASNDTSNTGVQVKSCYLNHEFFLLKLSMYGCQTNRDNVFKQIGLQGLYLIGKGYNTTDINLADELTYQDFILTKLNEFGLFKQEAIYREDFVTADSLHNQILQIRQTGDYVKQLILKREEASRQHNFLKMNDIEK